MTDPGLESTPTMNAPPNSAAELLRPYVGLVAWIVMIGAVLFIPLKIISYGYLPADDGLRHAAQGVSGKPWGDVIVLGEPLKVDFQFGWDLFLRKLHGWFGCGAEALAEISVVGLFVLLNVAALPWLRRPEAWFGALVLSWLAANPGDRFFLGRPLMVTISALVVILFATRAVGERGPRGKDVLWLTALIGVACWVHGTWYLWALPVVAFFLTGQFRWAMAMGVSWLVGAVLAGVCTGHPVAYLTEALQVAFRSTGSFAAQNMVAGELQPTVNITALLVVAALIVARQCFKAHWRPLRTEPAFWLVCIGWVLGCRAGRFWYDWGIPGLLVLLSLDLQTILESALPVGLVHRLVAVVFIALGTFSATTADLSGRWSSSLRDKYFSASDPNLAGWLPDVGGIWYSSSMVVFYQTYFHNPDAPWKYDLGFEPTLMPADDFATYHAILWSYGSDDNAYAPWVNKMRPQDRLVMVVAAPPQLAGLEWKHAFDGYWIGRLPRPHTTVSEPKAAK